MEEPRPKPQVSWVQFAAMGAGIGVGSGASRTVGVDSWPLRLLIGAAVAGAVTLVVLLLLRAITGRSRGG